MILTFEDDGCVHLYDSLNAVVLNIEALDAEECLRAVFDSDGQRYVIDSIDLNTRGRISLGNGRYRLVPSGGRDPRALVAALNEAGTRGLTERERSLVEGVRSRLSTEPYRP